MNPLYLRLKYFVNVLMGLELLSLIFKEKEIQVVFWWNYQELETLHVLKNFYQVRRNWSSGKPILRVAKA